MSALNEGSSADDQPMFKPLVVNDREVGVGWVVQVMDGVGQWGKGSGAGGPDHFLLKEELGRSGSAVYLGVGVAGPKGERFEVIEEQHPVAVKLTVNGDRGVEEVKRIAKVHAYAKTDSSGRQTQILNDYLIPIYLNGSIEVHDPRADGTFKRRGKPTGYRAIVQAVARPLCKAIPWHPSYLDMFNLGANVLASTAQLSTVARHGDIKPDNIATSVVWAKGAGGEWEREDTDKVLFLDVEGLAHKDCLSDDDLSILSPPFASKASLSVLFRRTLFGAHEVWKEPEFNTLVKLIGNESLSVRDDLWGAGISVTMLVTELGIQGEADLHLARSMFPSDSRVSAILKMLAEGSSAGPQAATKVSDAIISMWTQLELLASDAARTSRSSDLGSWAPILCNVLQYHTPSAMLNSILELSFDDAITRTQQNLESRSAIKYGTTQGLQLGGAVSDVVVRLHGFFESRAMKTSRRPTLPLLAPALRTNIERKIRQALEKKRLARVAEDEENSESDLEELEGGEDEAEEEAAAEGGKGVEGGGGAGRAGRAAGAEGARDPGGAEGSAPAEGSKGPRGTKRKLLEWELVRRDEARRVSLFRDEHAGKSKLEIDVFLSGDLPTIYDLHAVESFQRVHLKYFVCKLPNCSNTSFNGEGTYRKHLASGDCGWEGAQRVSWLEKKSAKTWVHDIQVLTLEGNAE